MGGRTMSSNDLLLFTVIFGSATLAVIFPAVGTIFQPYILYFMMTVLFLSFLKIDFRALLDRSVASLVRLGALVIVKLIILPTALYLSARLLVPEYALPILLLSGISTGVVAPFIATLLPADQVMTLRMVIVTSVLVPFTLPILVKFLAGTHMFIPLGDMIRLLVLVIFIPLAGVLAIKKFFPGMPDRIVARQYPVSLILFSAINLGVFSKYSDFIFEQPGQLLLAVGIAYLLSIIYYFAGFALTPGRGLHERFAWGISLGTMNNVLVIVFSSKFFGPLCPTLAAMYMFPFFTVIVPLRLIARYMESETSPPAEQT
jgi:BASS family bile acid:Na+ symporter